jgi:hypothetical protein
LLSHILDIYPASTALIVSTIEQIASGKRPSTMPQSNENSAYFSFPNQAEIEAFESKGYSFIDIDAYSEFIKRYI